MALPGCQSKTRVPDLLTAGPTHAYNTLPAYGMGCMLLRHQNWHKYALIRRLSVCLSAVPPALQEQSGAKAAPSHSILLQMVRSKLLCWQVINNMLFHNAVFRHMSILGLALSTGTGGEPSSILCWDSLIWKTHKIHFLQRDDQCIILSKQSSASRGVWDAH
jgi:hypothetical protein